MKVCAGNPYPMGPTVDGDGTNFALFSAHAEKVELCLFNDNGTREIARIPLPCRTDDIWHGYIHGVGEGALYGYRVYGPYEPESGHRFNHHKLLIDPYTRKLHGSLVDSDENLGYIPGHADADLSFDTRDNAHNIPKCVVTIDQAPTDNDEFPRHAMSDSFIYEAHIKGLTQQFPDTDKAIRGTYKAISSSGVLQHLQSLGVTALELLPVHTAVDDSFLLDRGLVNYWGYNTLCFFAPASRYAVADPIEEFREMAKSLHAANIELILDVVYNHTAEGNELGPTLSFRGIDNASYYRLADNPRYYSNISGCGNTLHTSHPRVVQLILDSLRYWREVMHVDGFRFDLATTLARRKLGYDKNSGFFDAIIQDPTLAACKLIAEPWDCGDGGYQLGNFPPRFSEWNDQYRDTVRRFWAGENGQLRRLSRAVHGSSAIFEWQRRSPSASINLITAHDGFTLTDLVSYNDKHNEANGEANRDGHGANYSNNHGNEGPTDCSTINNIREKQRRNQLATLLFSQGVPMILAGDELANSQQGNNNSYCQDNPVSWLDWSQLDSASGHLHFVKRLVQLRKQYPVLHRSHYMHGQHRSRSTGLPDISWFNKTSEAMTEDEWNDNSNRFFAVQLCGDADTDVLDDCMRCNATALHKKQKASFNSAPHSSGKVRAKSSAVLNAIKPDGIVLVAINGYDHDIDFKLPELDGQWHVEISTADPALVRTEINTTHTYAPLSVTLCSFEPD